jgi:hypothetical protein
MTPANEITLIHQLEVECSRCRSPMLCELVNRNKKQIVRVQGCVTCRGDDMDAATQAIEAAVAAMAN